MLADALKIKADEMQSLVHSHCWNGETMLNRIQSVVETESIAMLMNQVITSMQTAQVALEQKEYDAVTEEVDRTKRVMSELRCRMSAEVGGEFARELDESCQFIDQQLNRTVSRRRLASLKMATSVMSQITMIWRNGMEHYLIEQQSAAMNFADRSKDLLESLLYPENREEQLEYSVVLN